MASLLLRDVLLDGEPTNVCIEGNKIASVGPRREADRVVEGKGMAVLPGLINTHTHAAMSLFRGYADDVPLQPWLRERIWPLEGRLKPEDVYWGTKLACLEMIRTGTTCFNDMYFHMAEAGRAVREAGLRAFLSYGFIDLFDPSRAEEEIRRSQDLVRFVRDLRASRIQPALGPHAAYTVSASSLGWIKEYADAEDLLVHFHLAETEGEVKEFREKHGRPLIPYLDDLGFLGHNLVAAHAVWLDDGEIGTLARRGVKVAHCPTSNMKLASGVLRYRALASAGVTVSLATDGPASNNDLDMFEAMKIAALLQKLSTGDPTILTASEALALATEGGARALGLKAGRVSEGYLADLILVDLRHPSMVPNHNLAANVVYSSGGSAVDTVIVDGKILMRGGRVRGQDAIVEGAARAARELAERRG
jgi:5-methylthioadenosine/S-adenosylhomocysteine deaminase